jgi:hypothetical protein
MHWATTPDRSGQFEDGALRSSARGNLRRCSRTWGGLTATPGMPRKKFWVGASLVSAIIAVVCGVIALARSAEGSGSCFAQGRADLGAVGKPLWRTSLPTGHKKLVIALDDYVGAPRSDGTAVLVTPAAANRDGRPLPQHERVGAFLRGRSAVSKTRSLGFAVVAKAVRTRDGGGLDVIACADRPTRRSLSRPGRYAGFVHVAGPRIEGVDIPVEITIKGARTGTLILAFLVALFGAALAAANSKAAEVSAVKVAEKQTRHLLLSLLPFASGVVAGVLAGFALYADDPTFGADRGSDTTKLVVAAFSAATGGLTLLAGPTRAVRKKIAS